MSLPADIQQVLASYPSITLERADKAKLLNRVDTKYVIPVNEAIGLLQDVRPDYHALEIASQREGAYQTYYYDTGDMQMLNSHITGRFPRYKVRERIYAQNGLQFFEVKQKNNKGRTLKYRIPLSDYSLCLPSLRTERSGDPQSHNNHAPSLRTERSGDPQSHNNQRYSAIAGQARNDVTSYTLHHFLSQQTPFNATELNLVLINSFERITLINNEKTDRVTLDFNLQFFTPAGLVTPVFDQVVIVELKQEKIAKSPISVSLRNKGIRPCRMSKYCTGMLLTGFHTTYKGYKPDLSHFFKIQHHDTLNSTVS